uniref:TRP C-terminal domain-containing protein n=2 Tax=Spongospora subterranea TaxID=70186 RepID=A0A0H5R2V0_9EUKA|eukprot:CRZ08490.1 hypothetical protein [Spongospora subterranea]
MDGLCGAGLARGHCSLTADGEDVYEGNLCSSCRGGYGRVGQYECSKCPGMAQNMLLLSIALLCIIVFIAFTVVSTMKASSQPKAVHSIIIKIVMSSIQLNALALSFRFQWPDSVQKTMAVQSKAADVGQSILSVDCFLGSIDVSPFYIQSALFMGLPIFMAIAPLLAIVPYQIYIRISTGVRLSLDHIKDQYITSVIVSLFVIHPNIVQQTLKIFNCMSLSSQSGYSYLLADLSQQCWSSEHSKWVMATGLPMLILYVIGIPFSAYIILRKNQGQLDQIKMKMRYSFLSQGYTKSCYFWEIVVVGRKVLLSAISVFLSFSVIIQSLTALLLIILSLVSHVYHHPFENHLLDHIEFLSLFNSFITFMCGQYLFNTDVTQTAVVTTIVLVVSNVIFYGTALKALVSAIFHQYRDGTPRKEISDELITPVPAGLNQPDMNKVRFTMGSITSKLRKPHPVLASIDFGNSNQEDFTTTPDRKSDSDY